MEFKPTHWCKNCKHLLPLNGNDSKENATQWWLNNREQFRLMHLNGDCNTNQNQIVPIKKRKRKK